MHQKMFKLLVFILLFIFTLTEFLQPLIIAMSSYYVTMTTISPLKKFDHFESVPEQWQDKWSGLLPSAPQGPNITVCQSVDQHLDLS